MSKTELQALECAAFQLRVRFGLNSSEAIHTKTILRKENIIAMYKPLSDKAYGLSLKCGNNRFMLINSNSTRGRQHFTIAHELYHLYVEQNPKPHICDGAKTKEEQCADFFASAFLMPEGGILANIPVEEVLNRNISFATIIKLEQYFSVSRSALLIRLKQLNIITTEYYEQLVQVSTKSSAKEYGYDMALYEKGNEGLVIGDFGVIARKLFDDGKISEGNYREFLNQISNEED